MRPRLGILISGSGTNMSAVLDAIREGRLEAEAKLVLSNKADAKGLARAADRAAFRRR